MKKIIFLVLWALMGVIQAGQPVSGNLTVRLSPFSHSTGFAVVKLFRKQDDVMGKSFRRGQGKILAGASTLVFENIPYGEYALIAFHDQNANGDLDHNFFNFPDEPIGFSGRYSLGLFSGMPSFAKLRFVFNAAHEVYEIKMENNEEQEDE